MAALVLLVFWLLVSIAFVRGVPALVTLFFCAIPFGSLAAVPPALTAGLTFTPLPIVAALLSLRILMAPGQTGFLLHLMLRPRSQAFLFLFLLVCILTTLIMPRLFAGEILVVPVRAIEGPLAPLYPSTQNVSQLAYLTISIVTALTVSVGLRDARSRSLLPRAILMGCLVTIGTGILDFANSFVPLDALLDAFRTATYALLVDAEVLGARRVVGLMPEASAFGSTCVVLLALLFFARRAFSPGDPLRVLALPACAILAVFAVLSSSSAAYAGLGIFMGAVGLEWLWRLVRFDPGTMDHLTVEAIVALLAVVVVVALVLFQPALIDRIGFVLDDILVSKTTSSSFEERSMWTRTAWEALGSSWGLGIGVGSARASNFWVALASNTGYLGAFLFAAFVICCYLRRRPLGDKQGAALLTSGRWALLPTFLIGILIGTSPDFGPITAMTLGMMLAVGRPRTEPYMSSLGTHSLSYNQVDRGGISPA
ncbi:hypothetical protein [Aureimonas sp. AU20]|uniref:hypothetical protein n=1 Tax=Aureimonas sp. AU20 TaxID=1349819 RepID=UPI00071F07B9|nr:hypothetical protein [Aureimonas sp. AU20]ALN72849.1 hypothetical protein M673_08980 [Aureimonas sp. AU20]